MFGIGIAELLIIGVILLLLIGIPIIVVVAVLVIVNRSKSRTHDNAGSEKSNAGSDARD